MMQFLKTHQKENTKHERSVQAFFEVLNLFSEQFSVNFPQEISRKTFP